MLASDSNQELNVDVHLKLDRKYSFSISDRKHDEVGAG